MRAKGIGIPVPCTSFVAVNERGSEGKVGGAALGVVVEERVVAAAEEEELAMDVVVVEVVVDAAAVETTGTPYASNNAPYSASIPS